MPRFLRPKRPGQKGGGLGGLTRKALGGGKGGTGGKNALSKIRTARKVLVVLGPLLPYIAIAALVIGLVVAIVILFSGAPDIQPREDALTSQHLELELLTTYRQATAGDNDYIPWTVLAGIGWEATQHGRFGPDDQDQYGIGVIDRAPERSGDPNWQDHLQNLGMVDANGKSITPSAYPVVAPPIGGATDAQGPLLLWPELLADYAAYTGDQPDPQNWVDSLAVAIWEIDRIRATMDPAPDYRDDPAAWDAYWVGVIDQFRGGRAHTVELEELCGVTADTPTDVAISRIVRCTVTQSNVSEFHTTWKLENAIGVDTDGNATAELLYSDAPLDPATYTLRVINDLQDWSFAATGYANLGCADETGVIDGSIDVLRTPRGIFGLDYETAQSLGLAVFTDGDERCNRQRSIEAVTAALINVDRTPVADRADPATKLYGGFAAFDATVGDQQAQDSYYNSLLNIHIDAAACDQTVDTWLRSHAGAGDFDILNPDGSSVEEIVAALGDAASGQLRYGRMSNLLNSDAPPEGCTASISGVVERYLNEVRESYGAADDLSNDADAASAANVSRRRADAIEAWFRFEQNTKAQLAHDGAWLSSEVLAGTPAVSRFATNGGVTHPPVDEIGSTAAITPVGFGITIVTDAVRLGGMFPGDERGLADLTFNGSLVLYRDASIKHEEDHILDSATADAFTDAGKLVWLGGCGAATNSAFRAQPILAEKWMALCQAAQADGITLTIVSASRTMASQQALYDKKGGTLAATPGHSYHEWGLAIDVSTSLSIPARDWMHAIVGCYTPGANSQAGTYVSFGQPVDYHTYADDAEQGNAACPAGSLPIKRVQTYGLVFAVCNRGDTSPGPDSLANPDVIRCEGTGPSGGVRESWHLQVGEPVPVAGAAVASFNSALCPTTGTSDDLLASSGLSEFGTSGTGRYTPQQIAQRISMIVTCLAQEAGFGLLPARTVTWTDLSGETHRFDGPAQFPNLAAELAAEAVVVGYCESGAFNERIAYDATSNNSGFDYLGVFQIGDDQFKKYGPAGGSRLDPDDNIVAAANYMIAEIRGQRKWDGWGPWAVVNTDYGNAENAGVKVPVLPRFPSTRPGYTGAQGAALPDWAINPYQFAIPTSGCGSVFSGGQWAPSRPLTP